MATEFIPVSGYDALVSSLVSLLEGGDESKIAASEFTKPHADPVKLVQHFVSRIPQLFESLDPSQFEAAYSVIFQVATTIQDTNASVQAVSQIAESLSGAGAPFAPLRLKLLASFFNSFDTSAVQRHGIYVSMLKLITQENLTTSFGPALVHNAESLISQWTSNAPNGSAMKSEALYHVMKVAEASAGGPSALFNSSLTGATALLAPPNALATSANVDAIRDSLYAYLQSVDPQTAKSTPEVAESVERLLRYGIRTVCPASHVYALDALLEIPAVEAFKDSLDTEAGAAYRIAYLLCFGSLAEFRTEITNDAIRRYMESKGLTLDFLTSRMTGMVIASLAEDNPKLSYQEVAQAIDAKSDEDVEFAVVEAATSGIIEAHLNQQNKTIRFDSVKPRAFSSSRWRLLDAKLNEWKRAITQAVFDADTKVKKAVALEAAKV